MIERDTMSRQVLVYSLGALVGVISGFTAVILRVLILGLSYLFIAIPAILGSIGWIIAPAIGGLFVAIIVVKYAPEAKGHGVPEVMEAYVLHDGKMRLRVPILKSIASAITIGSGGSCGREGPIAQIGGGAGSAISSYFRLDKNETKTMVVCGLASGIAATFNAPLGGALFGIEVVAGGIVGFSILPVILSSVVATAVSNFTIGSIVSFESPQFELITPAELVMYLFLGIILGVISVIWSRGFYVIEDLFDRIRTSKYLIPAIGGGLTGILGVVAIYLESISGYHGSFHEVGLLGLPEPYLPAVMGVEYAFIDTVLQWNPALMGTSIITVFVLFGLMKIFTTSFTLGSGGSGGVFAPTLYMGAAFGGFFGLFFWSLFPSVITQPLAFALVGMAALFAGSARAPITCIVIITEMTNDYFLVLPLMIAVSASYLVSSLIEKESIYTMKLRKRGVHISRGTHIGALKEIEVTEIMTRSPTVLNPDMSVQQVFEIIDSTHHTKFPVVEDGNVVGILVY
jgi:CIC family chloride channel protein